MHRTRYSTILVGLLIVGLTGAIAGQPASGGGFTELRRFPIVGSTDLEAVMGLIERPAASVGAKHQHPGGELGYVLKGSVVIESEDGRTVTLGAGDSFYQPPGEWHIVTTTHEATETLVYRIVRKGEPMVVPVD